MSMLSVSTGYNIIEVVSSLAGILLAILSTLTDDVCFEVSTTDEVTADTEISFDVGKIEEVGEIMEDNSEALRM